MDCPGSPPARAQAPQAINLMMIAQRRHILPAAQQTKRNAEPDAQC